LRLHATGNKRGTISPRGSKWRDENIRATEAYRAWADAGTRTTWRAYEEAFDREHEPLMRYVALTQR
jgi:hypothetical protein